MSQKVKLSCTFEVTYEIEDGIDPEDMDDQLLEITEAFVRKEGFIDGANIPSPASWKYIEGWDLTMANLEYWG